MEWRGANPDIAAKAPLPLNGPVWLCESGGRRSAR